MSKLTDRARFRQRGPTVPRDLSIYVALLVMALAAATVIVLGANSPQPEMDAWTSE